MTAKERDRKARRLFGMSFGAYALAYLHLAACYMVKAPKHVSAYGFLIFTLIGAVNAYAYGSLPRRGISPEEWEELEQMLSRII